MNFKEWYDKQSAATQSLVATYAWVDLNEPDYIRKSEYKTVEDYVKALSETSKYDEEYSKILSLAAVLKQYKDTEYGSRLQDTFEYWLSRMGRYDKRLLLNLFDLVNDRALCTNILFEGHTPRTDDESWYPLEKLIYYCQDNMEDLLKYNIKLSDIFSPVIHQGVIDIVGYDTVRKTAISNYDIAINLTPECGVKIHDQLFEDLFFSADGWDNKHKLWIVRSISRYKVGFDFVVQRIVPKDHQWLYVALRSRLADNPREGTNIYNAKDESGKYIYDEDIRKLALARRCCLLKDISDKTIVKLGAMGVLIQEYKYDFDEIYKQMYPSELTLALTY